MEDLWLEGMLKYMKGILCVYIKPDDNWVDLNYAYEEGFLDPD